MITKKFIFENENTELKKLNDFEKVLRINKGKLKPYDANFVNSEGEDFSDYLEITKNGILFEFNGLSNFLQFFFPNEYGPESNYEYEASYFESMYDGTWSWYDDYNDIADDDYDEGYIIGSFDNDNIELVKEISKIIDPNLYNKINKGIVNVENVLISDMLSTLNLKDNIIDAYIDANINMLDDLVPKYIKDTYCNCLEPIGIETISCFWKYEMDWASVILLYALQGDEEQSLFDVIFTSIREKRINHLPEYYEVRYNVWDKDLFNKYFQPKIKEMLEDILYKIEFEDHFTTKYLDTLKKISKIGGLDRHIYSKDRKLWVKMLSIDPVTNKVIYMIGNTNNSYNSKKGKADINDIINLLYNKTLFNPMDIE